MFKNEAQLAPFNLPTGDEFYQKLQATIHESSGQLFFVVVIQMANIEVFQRRRSAAVVAGFYQELGRALRQAVHPSQHVGRFQNGLGLIFKTADVGKVDFVVSRLLVVIQEAIKRGKYNDLSGRWTDIVYQFLHPNNPGVVFPRAGWSIYPRDGETPLALIRRALYHLNEIS